MPRKSGHLDVVAKNESERIAIEIETGKSDFVRNVKQDLLAGYDKVLVVATGKKAFAKVERELAATGLLGLARVVLVLANG